MPGVFSMTNMGPLEKIIKVANYSNLDINLKFIQMKNTTIQLSMFDVAEVELIYKSKVPPSQRRKITCSKDAKEVFMENWNDDNIEHIEEFEVLLLNSSYAVLGILAASKGTVTDVRIILQAALKSNASGLVVCHNYPLGNLNPSESDTKITQEIKKQVTLWIFSYWIT